MLSKHGILALAAAVFLAGCASDNVGLRSSSQAPDTSGAQARDFPEVGATDKSRISGHTSDADYKFIRDAESGGLFEVSAGQKAVDKSQDPLVKSLAQHMVDDHTKFNGELTNLASRKGMADTAGLTAAQVALLARLDNVTGLDFDRAYLSQQRTAHQDAIAEFETASANADDKDIRDWASATLPALRNHLTMIENQQRTPPSNLRNGATDNTPSNAPSNTSGNAPNIDAKNGSNSNSGMSPSPNSQ